MIDIPVPDRFNRGFLLILHAFFTIVKGRLCSQLPNKVIDHDLWIPRTLKEIPISAMIAVHYSIVGWK